MKIKSLLKTIIPFAAAAYMFCSAVLMTNGNTALSIRAGEENILQNKDMDKQIGISVGGKIVDSFPVGICLRGDADLNGTTNIFDAVTVAKYTVGTAGKGFEDSKGYFAGNVNEDGKLNIFDAVCIARFTVANDESPDAVWDKVLEK